MEWLWRTGERARRIEALLAEAAAPGGVTARQMAALQLDVFSGGAERILEPVLDLAGSPAQLGPEEREVLALLRDWDRRAASDSVGAAVYHVFLGRLVRVLLEPVLGPALYERYVGLAQANPTALVARVLAAASAGRQAAAQVPPEWTRARVREAVQRTLRETWLHFGVTVGPNRDKWAWGRLHALQFRPFGLLRWTQLPERALGPHEYPGDPTSIAAGGYAFREPFAVRTASTHRLAADAAELDTLLVSIAPGQVEQPAHPHRADQVEAWLAGRPAPLVTSALLVEEQAVARLELVPEGAP
jgi:acyl-homoserine lactone acylase PvdQ